MDNVELWLLGGFESEEFENECKLIPGWKNVDYLGSVPPTEIYGYIKMADVGVVTYLPYPNHVTALPTKAFEYMAGGIPMLMSNFDYWKELFGDIAHFADPAKPQEIAAVIREMLLDKIKLEAIHKRSLELIENAGQKEGMANLGEQRNEVLSVDKQVFFEELNRLMAYHDRLDAFTFFKLVHSAFDKALNDHNKKSLIFYHIHNPDTYAQLNFLKSAPDTNWLMMVREPLQSCESWVQESFSKNDYQGVVNRIFQMLFEIDNIIYQNENSIGLRLEDLKQRPKKTIPALCAWLGIKEEDSLYEMTAQGKKWWGDPASPDFAKDGMNPFGKTSISRKIGSVFSNNDQFILHTLFYPFSVRFGYAEENIEQFKTDLQTIRPKLDQMFDFERKIVVETHADIERFMKSGSYLYLRSGMIERWNTLNTFHTYPNMLTPLKIH